MRRGCLVLVAVLRVAGVLCALAVAVVAVPAGPAAAHPLGNFSVNEYAGLTLSPDRITVAVVVDTAEISTSQDRGVVDADGDGTVSAAERAAYAARACRDFGSALEVTAPDRLAWAVTPGDYVYEAAPTGLPTARLTCALAAPVHLIGRVTVSIANRYRDDRVGWHELTAVGDRVRLVDSPLPEHTVSDELRSYPPSPVDVRTATLRVEPGSGGHGDGGHGDGGQGDGGLRAGSSDPLTALASSAERGFEHLVAGPLTPLVAVLAVLLALLLGAGHAALPGHGKTVLAAYLAGRHGRPRDALAIGATVTLTHTFGVLLMGLLLTLSTTLAGDRLLGYLGLASGVIVVAVGLGMVVTAVRRRPEAGADHARDHTHSHAHDHADGHDHDQGHGHDQGDGRDHRHHHAGGRMRIAGIGVAGGLVPSPSALVVLLAAVGLGRAVFGVLLVIVYGLGMAATLTAAGLLLLAVQRRMGRRFGRRVQLARRLAAALPLMTASLVIVVGAGLAARAAYSLW